MKRNMNLSEIIIQNEKVTESIEYGQLHPYLKSLYIYYKNYFFDEPILMVTDVMNTCQYARIVPSNEFTESICDYLQVDSIVENKEEGFDEDIFAQYETINFNSKFLKDLLK